MVLGEGWKDGRGDEEWNEGWLLREDEGRENTLCPYFWAPSGIHSSWSFLFRCCCCRNMSLFFLILSRFLCPPHFLLSVFVCKTRINVFIFLRIPSFSHLNSQRQPLMPSAFQKSCNFFLIILMLPVLPSIFFCLCSPIPLSFSFFFFF